MKERYIRQVWKQLRLPRKAKTEVLRDLEEAFASAAEHGETEAQVVERLGTPEAFAEGIHEQLGIAPAGKAAGKTAVLVFSILICAAAFSAALFIHASRPAPDSIGQAVAVTGIQIVGDGIDVFRILLVVGCLALLAAICVILRGIHHKN